MKKTIMICIVAVAAMMILPSCNNCKTCSVKAMGIQGPAKEYCGDELKSIQQMPGVSCE